MTAKDSTRAVRGGGTLITAGWSKKEKDASNRQDRKPGATEQEL